MTEPNRLPTEFAVVALALTIVLGLWGMAVGGGVGWLMTVPLVGLGAYGWPRWLWATPLLGLGLSAGLYSGARALGAPAVPLLPTLSAYVLLAGTVTLALALAARQRRELEELSAWAEFEQQVLDILAEIAQLSARPELGVGDAARQALLLTRAALPLDSALLLTAERQAEVVLSCPELGAAAPDPGEALWAAHAAQTLTFVNGAAGRDAWAVVPLLQLEGPPLSLAVTRGRGTDARWSVHERQLVQAVARASRLAAEREQHLRELAYSASHDALTGSLNRHAFTRATALLNQGAGAYSLAVLDLDGFKALNDREGHARGDEALRAFAAALRAAFPAPAELYRLGGDEFALLWPLGGPDTGAFLERVGQIPAALRAAGLDLAGVSAGLAHAREGADSGAVLALADRRMYGMKGRCAPERPGAAAAPAPRPGFLALEPALELLGAVLEARDAETHHHSRRVAGWARALGEHLGLGPGELGALTQGAFLHDLGKLGVPDRVLLKPGPLDPEEWRLARAHAAEGHRLASRLPFLDPGALEVIRHHHERWDGQGYPDRLAGAAIPRLARIYAVVDVFDALTSVRPYKAAWPTGQALAELRAQAGQQFDPEVVAAFLTLWSGHGAHDAPVADLPTPSETGAWPLMGP